MQRAKYKLRDHGRERIVFERRYIPRTALIVCLLVLGAALLVQSTGPSQPGAIVLGWVSIGFLVFFRRADQLTLSLCSDDSGSAITIAGQASDKARRALDERFSGEQVSP